MQSRLSLAVRRKFLARELAGNVVAGPTVGNAPSAVEPVTAVGDVSPGKVDGVTGSAMLGPVCTTGEALIVTSLRLPSWWLAYQTPPAVASSEKLTKPLKARTSRCDQVRCRGRDLAEGTGSERVNPSDEPPMFGGAGIETGTGTVSTRCASADGGGSGVDSVGSACRDCFRAIGRPTYP
jgi:hypothetical protein